MGGWSWGDTANRITLRKFLPLRCWDGLGQGVGWRGWEGACVGSGICGNQMCWQLRGKWQSGVGDLGWGLVPFRPPGLPPASPTEPRFSLFLCVRFSLFLCFCPLQLCFQSPVSNPWQGVEGEERPLPLPPLPAAVSSGSFTFLLLVSLPPPPRFSFCLLLPQFLSLMMCLTPSPTPTCRRLARWAGASRSCK